MIPAPFDRVINRSDPSRGHRCRNKAFDYLDPSTWDGAFAGVELMFLAGPAALSNVPRDILPALQAAKRARVKHNVVLSLQCAESNKVVPRKDREVASLLRAAADHFSSLDFYAKSFHNIGRA